MFIQPKIRGVPLYALAMSGFYPQIFLLAKRWHEKNRDENPIKSARPNYWLKTMAWFLLILGLCPFFVDIKMMENFKFLGGLFSAMGLFIFVLDTLLQPWKFVNAVNRLDECLRRECAGGIARLPNTDVAIVFERFLRDKMERGASLVLLHEEEEGRESPQAKDWLAFMNDLGSIAKEFGHDLGEWNPYFEEAKKRLARERQKKENSLPDHAPIKA